MGAIGYGQDVYPTGSSTAKDSVFDNTGTDLESTNAEDAIKEVDGKVEELSSNVSELHNYTLDNHVDISSYVEGQSAYICPTDGYFMVTSDAVNHVVIGYVSHKSLITALGTSAEPYFHSTIFVRKNSVLSILGNGTGAFFPLI